MRKDIPCHAQYIADIERAADDIDVYNPCDPEEIPNHDEPDPDGSIDGPADVEMDGNVIEEFDFQIPADEHDQNNPENYENDLSDRDDDVDDPRPTPTSSQPLVERYPHQAATTYGKAPTPFEKRRQDESAGNSRASGPFDDVEQYELAEWIVMSGLSGKKVDKFLKLRSVSSLSYYKRKCCLELTWNLD